MPKVFLKVVEKYFKQRLKIFSQPLWQPKTFWSPNSVTKKLDNQKISMTRTSFTRKFSSWKKIVDIYLDKWNRHVQMNANIMMNINCTHPIILDNLTWINTQKHIGKGWKMLEVLVFSAIGALKTTLKTMGWLGRMLREIKECKKC